MHFPQGKRHRSNAIGLSAASRESGGTRPPDRAPNTQRAAATNAAACNDISGRDASGTRAARTRFRWHRNGAPDCCFNVFLRRAGFRPGSSPGRAFARKRSICRGPRWKTPGSRNSHRTNAPLTARDLMAPGQDLAQPNSVPMERGRAWAREPAWARPPAPPVSEQPALARQAWEPQAWERPPEPEPLSF
jgi:hypothetical protein